MNVVRWLKLRRAMPSAECVRVAEMLQEYLDVEGSPEAAARVQAHLDECRDCGLEADAFVELKEAVRRHGEADSGAKHRLQDFAERLSRGGLDTAGELSS